MMLGSKRSMMNSTTNSSKSVSKRGKETFIQWLYRTIRQKFAALWMYSRKFMWVVSTGMILIILPFMFAYNMEMQNEMHKLQMQGRGQLL